MRSVPSPTDVSAIRGLARPGDAFLPPNPSVVPISCFITTEAGLDSLASSPELDVRVKTPVQDPRDSLATQSISPVRRSRAASFSSLFDLDCAVSQPPTCSPPAAHGFQSDISAPLSPATSSSCSLSEFPHDSSAGSPAASPSRETPQDPPMGMYGGTVPQLVMPSLTVPERRSFSDVGKSMGRLKLLVTGRPGIGKTSLIEAMGKNCQHIVHMDPLELCPVGKVREIHASTRPHPWWQAHDIEAAPHARRRRQSLTEEILDRNLCFLDCSAVEGEGERYFHRQLSRLCDRPIGDEDLFHLLCDGAEPIVHAVLYMVPSTGPSPVDVRCLKNLQDITNVIPLLARADELAGDEVATAKDCLAQTLSSHGLEWFSFARPDSAQHASGIYAVSNEVRSDCLGSDASIHMSFEILQPRISTDLDDLIERVFSLEGSSWLRHSAALRSVSWRRRQLLERTSCFAVAPRRFTPNGTLVSFTTGTNLYLERRHWECIELSNWAARLQQSLKAELIGRLPRLLGSEVGSEMRVAKTGPFLEVGRGQTTADPGNANYQDPLGLLELGCWRRHGGKLALELMSSLGVFGCIAMWLIRPEMARYWETGLPPSSCLVRL